MQPRRGLRSVEKVLCVQAGGGGAPRLRRLLVVAAFNLPLGDQRQQ